jgi:hypothetical protein
MLRVLALLCSLALLLAPLGPAQATPACALLATAQAHFAHSTDHQMPTSGHPTQACKQLCAVVAILTPPEPVIAQGVSVRPLPSSAARLIESQLPGPSERPPKDLV